MTENTDIKTLRFKEMDATGELMVKEIATLKKILETYKIFEDGHLERYCFAFLESKAGNKPLRAYFFSKTCEYLAHYEIAKTEFDKYPESKVLFAQKLPFVFELVIVIQYLHNQILDEKYDVKKFNHPKVCHNLISSNILRELLFLYLEQEIAPFFQHKQFQMLQGAIRKLLLWVDFGQHIDKEYNHYHRWKNGLPPALTNPRLFDEVAKNFIDPLIAKVQRDTPGREAFVMAYFQRIYFSNVYFFRCMTKTILALIDYKGDMYAPLQQFSIQYGFMLQIINDYADFAYTDDKKERNLLKTSSKSVNDVFADLYNFNITLPLIYHLQKGGKRKIETYLEGGEKQKSKLTRYPRQIMQEIVQSGGIIAAIQLSRDLSKSASACLDPDNPVSPYLKNMCDMALYNKFYRVFK